MRIYSVRHFLFYDIFSTNWRVFDVFWRVFDVFSFNCLIYICSIIKRCRFYFFNLNAKVMKSDSKFNRVIIEITCVLFALLFVYASISKLLDFERFQVQIAQSPILSVYAFWISRIVIAVELFAAGILLFARTKMLGLYTSIGLMGMFTAYIFIILFYSSFVPCSCGGILEKMTWESHLVFNVFFLVLGVTAVYLLNKMPEHKYRFGGKRPLFYSTVIILVSCFLVAGLFLSSEKIIHQQNPFIRRYEQSLVSPLREIDLKFNSYYFAGVVKDTVYLGNYTDPFHLLAVDLSGNKKTIQLEFEPKGIPFQAIRIIIRGKDVYLLDGTVPCVYRGSIGKWKMNKELKNVPRFTAAQPIDSVSIAFRNNTGKNKAHILGVFGQENDEKIRYAPQLLQQQIDGIFDTDGMLLYDQELKLMVYSYYYRNEFFTADTRAVLQSRGHTIDTGKRGAADSIRGFFTVHRYAADLSARSAFHLRATGLWHCSL